MQRLNATQQLNDQTPNPQIQHQPADFDRSAQDDFLDQMLHNFPSPWPDLPTNPNINSFFNISRPDNNRPIDSPRDPFPPPENDDSSLLLASRFRQHQISSNSPAGISSSNLFSGGTSRSTELLVAGSSSPCFLVDRIGVSSAQGLYDHQQHLQLPQSHGAPATRMNQSPATGSSGGTTAPVRQKVRARRGQATDPHSIAERLRRERIAERMKSLQELVPIANKTDKASMLDEIIDYVKFLQIQVKVLSMSRLGGTAAVAPLVADISSEASGMRGKSNGTQREPNDSLTVTEHQVAKLMDEDVGSAMQYLQGKGLCIMPISLATAISTATCHYKNAPSSPSMSVLTVQSALGNGGADTDVTRPSPTIKDAASVSKP